MKKFIIVGSKKGVRGSVDINGAKNSCLPIMASSILFNGTIILRNVPFVDDVKKIICFKVWKVRYVLICVFGFR